MVNLYTNNFSSTTFDFHFTTSSGDKIDLKMSDKVNVEKNLNSSGYEMTLSHEYGYEFKYEGNGLDKNDIKEIKEALEKIKPLFEKFLKAREENSKMVTNFANSLKTILPKPKDDNHLNFIKQNTLNLFDDSLKSIKATMKELEKTKELFDKLFSNRFDIIA